MESEDSEDIELDNVEAPTETSEDIKEESTSELSESNENDSEGSIETSDEPLAEDLPEQFETIVSDDPNDPTLAVVDVIEDVNSLEDLKDILTDEKRISVQTLKAVKLALESYSIKYGSVNLGLESFDAVTSEPFAVRDQVETKPTETAIEPVNQAINNLLSVKKESIKNLLLNIDSKLDLTYKAIGCSLAKINTLMDANVSNLRKPKTNKVCVTLNNIQKCNEVLKREYHRNHVSRALDELRERLIHLEFATEYVYSGTDTSKFKESLKEHVTGLEDYEPDYKFIDNYNVEYDVRPVKVIYSGLEKLKTSCEEHLSLIADIKVIIARIINNVNGIDFNEKDTTILNEVICILSNGRLFRQPLMHVSNELEEIKSLVNVASTELETYTPDTKDINSSMENFLDSDNPLVDFKVLKNKMASTYLNPEWFDVKRLRNLEVEAVSIDQLSTNYENYVELVKNNTLNNQTLYNKYYDKIKGELLELAGEIDVNNIVESIRSKLQDILNREAVKLPQLDPVDNLPFEIKETKLAALNEDNIDNVIKATNSTIDLILDAPVQHFGREFSNTFFRVDDSGKIVPILDVDNLVNGLEGDDLMVVTQYVSSINKQVQALIDNYVNNNKEFFNQTKILVQALIDWLDSQVE